MGNKGVCCACCTANVVVYCVLITAIILAILGASFQPLFKILYDDKVRDTVILKKDGESYNNWVKAPLPLYMNYYVFNYTNVEEFLNGSIPNAEQIGPYVYKETRLNYILEENDEEITYLQNYTYVFDTERSCANCSENDVIHTPNLALWTMLHLLRGANVTTNSSQTKQIIIGVVNGLLKAKGVTPFHYLPVKKLIWGYDDPFVEFLIKNEVELQDQLKLLNITLPKFDPFIALQHNGTNEASFVGNVTLKTGKEKVDNLQKIVKWRGLNKSPYWTNDYGEMINGTDGTHFKPFLDKEDDSRLYVFITDACRSLYIDYESELSIRDIRLYRYTLADDVFANATANPNNGAFCVGGCWKAGLLPVGQCLSGDPPVFLSNPHFYQGDQSLVSDVNGMEPNKSLHQTLIDIEPVTGLTMNVHKRLQINVLTEIVPLITMSERLRQNQTFLPVFYLDETTTIDKKNADKYKHEVVRPKTILEWSRYGLYILGGLLFIIAIIAIVSMIIMKTKDRSKEYRKI